MNETPYMAQRRKLQESRENQEQVEPKPSKKKASKKKVT